MTLIEVLIAVFVLAIGLVGILALFPIAVDGVGLMVKRTNAAIMADNASVALGMGAVKLYANGSTNDWRPQISDGATDFWVVKDAAGANAVKTSQFADWPRAIALAGYTTLVRNFQMPRDLVRDAADVGSEKLTFLDETGNLISPASLAGVEPLSLGYGWSATFVPMAAPVSANTAYRVQIAVWRAHHLVYDADTSMRFEAPNRVVFDTLPANFDEKVTVGDYIRQTDHGVWYKITGITGSVLTVAPDTDAAIQSAASSNQPYQVASHRWLVGLFQTAVYPTASQ